LLAANAPTLGILQRVQLPRFEDLAASANPTLDLLALALAAAFRPVDAARALATLDGLGAEVARVLDGSSRTPRAEAVALSHVLRTVHGFTRDTEQYDRPENSTLDHVLERNRGLPILLSVVYVEAPRRAAVPVAGVGLPGHYVVAHRRGRTAAARSLQRRRASHRRCALGARASVVVA